MTLLTAPKKRKNGRSSTKGNLKKKETLQPSNWGTSPYNRLFGREEVSVHLNGQGKGAKAKFYREIGKGKKETNTSYKKRGGPGGDETSRSNHERSQKEKKGHLLCQEKSLKKIVENDNKACQGKC